MRSPQCLAPASLRLLRRGATHSLLSILAALAVACSSGNVNRSEDGAGGGSSGTTGGSSSGSGGGGDTGASGGSAGTAGTMGGAGTTSTCGASSPDPIVLDSAHHPFGLTVSGGNVFWTNYEGGAVDKIPVDGGALQVLTRFDAGDPYGIAVDGTSVYWMNNTGFGLIGALTKVPIDGGDPVVLAGGTLAGGTVSTVSGYLSPVGVAVDATSVYWTNYDEGTVSKVSINGGATTELYSGGSPLDLKVDETHVYWTSSSTLYKVPLGGGTRELVASGADTIALDATNVYFVNNGTAANNGAVMKVAKAGGTPSSLATGQNAPFAIAVDSGHVYWTTGMVGSNAGTGTIRSVPLEGGTVETIVSGGSPYSLAVDDCNIYWSNFDEGTLMKLAKK